MGGWVARRRVWLWVPVAVGLAVVVLWLVLGPLAYWFAAPGTAQLPAEREAAVISGVRQTLLQAVGGTAALSALVFTATNYLLNRRGQVTERYTAAIGQLASEQLAERIGGIYALEHLMRESERDHTTVVEVLAAFVRENAPVDDTAAPAPKGDRDRWMHPPAGTPDAPSAERSARRMATDVQTALAVLARRPNRPDPTRWTYTAPTYAARISRALASHARTGRAFTSKTRAWWKLTSNAPT